MGQLIINADDYGISENVNEAVKIGVVSGIIDRATVMVNMPYAEEAYYFAKENNYLDKIGLHINLIEGMPLTDNIRKTWLCDNGMFNGKISLKRYKKVPILDPYVLYCIEEEINAQMLKFVSMGFSLLHLDSHQHAHIKPSIFPIVLKLAKTNSFTSIRLAAIIPSDQPKLSTRIYKEIINSKIKEFNEMNASSGQYSLVDAGCAYMSLLRQTRDDKGAYLRKHNIEMWFHPAMRGDNIVNLFSDEPFDIEDLVYLKKIGTGCDDGDTA